MAPGPAQLTGTVVHLGPPTVAPRLRSAWPAVIWTSAAVLLLLPALIAFAIVRFAMSLASTAPHRPRRSHFLTELLGRLTAHHIGRAGNTMVTVARLRDQVGQLVNLRIEGHAESGALAVGDVITVRLRTVNGIHIVVDGHNHTANERIRLRL